ncbi:unnamed protein product, partial [Rotaria sp. Silwood2]
MSQNEQQNNQDQTEKSVVENNMTNAAAKTKFVSTSKMKTKKGYKIGPYYSWSNRNKGNKNNGSLIWQHQPSYFGPSYGATLNGPHTWQ